MSWQALGAVAQGLNQGLTLKQQDDLLAEQKAARERNQQFQDEQREQWRLQNQRANEAADRAEELRRKNAAIQPVGSDVTVTRDLRDTVLPGAKEITVDDDGNPSAAAIPALQTTTRKFTDADAARALAGNLQSVGDVAGALSARQTAEKLSMAQARAAFARLDASSAGMPLHDYVNALADIGARDESPIDFRPTKINPDGTVGVTVFNRHTGYEMPLTIKDAAHAREVAQSHFNPEGYEAWRLEQAKSALRQQEERNKPHAVAPNAKLVAGDGKVLASNPVPTRYFDPATGERVEQGGGSGGGGRGGSGKGNGKDPVDPDPESGLDLKKIREQATVRVDKVVDPEGKFTPEQRERAINQLVDQERRGWARVQKDYIFTNQMEAILRKSASDPRRYASEWEKLRATPGGANTIAELERRGLKAPAPILTQPGGLTRPAR